MGYSAAPWIFKGRALYQLQFVKIDEAKKYIPEDFKLVNFFGYTLGGFYLARYSDSPVGAFDELVVLGGLVWNFPTSCAWAARVYVNNKEARNHGQKSVGLPSRSASFGEALSSPGSHQHGWWRQPLDFQQGGALPEGDYSVAVQNVERGRRGKVKEPVCTLQLPAAWKAWPGPRIKMALPSYSGGTPEHPGMLQYACKLWANVRLVSPARVLPNGSRDEGNPESMAALLGGRPLVAFVFDNMELSVDEPVAWERFVKKGLDQIKLQGDSTKPLLA